MTTAAELASYASSFPSFRNRIINGNLSNPINQQGILMIVGTTMDQLICIRALKTKTSTMGRM